MQPTEVWEVQCRPLGPGTQLMRWAIRAWEAEDALDRFCDAGWCERDVVAVRRAPAQELDS